jgi:RNA polymerase sigma-70 factor (ECF subfamily)
MHTHPTDEHILELFSRGDAARHEAFHILVKSYGDILYRQIRAIVRNHEFTNDILQNTLLKIYENLGGFKGESALYTWMYRIARNEALNYLDKEKRRSGVDLDAPIMEIIAGNQALDTLDGETIQAWLDEAISSLPEKQAAVFHLKYFEDMKYSTMSALLSTSEGALKASFHHARQKIEEFVRQKLNQ